MIYLDHAATTQLRPEAREAMLPFLGERFGNPSWLYAVGRDAQEAVDAARRTVAECLGARPPEVLFTSGGTESINAATLGIAYAMRRAGAGNHVITSAIEHHAGLHVAQHLEELGFEVTTIGCDSDGKVSVTEFVRALRPGTVLASVMLENNEVGTIQPIVELAGILREFAREAGHRVALHTDAVQAPGWMALDVEKLGVDALSLSSHKFGGPKGSGVLYLRRATPFRPLLHGGGQEMQKRAGTENVAGIVGTATALRLAASGSAERAKRVRELRDKLRDGILESVADAQGERLPGGLRAEQPEHRVRGAGKRHACPAAGCARDRGELGERLFELDVEPSHVLMAMGVPIRRAVGACASHSVKRRLKRRSRKCCGCSRWRWRWCGPLVWPDIVGPRGMGNSPRSGTAPAGRDYRSSTLLK